MPFRAATAACCAALCLGACAREGGPDYGVADTSAAATSARTLTLETLITGQYVCAEGGGGGEVNANRDVARGWETFTLVDENGGALESGDLIFLVASNGLYLQAYRGGGDVNAASPNQLDWETFRIVKRDGEGRIETGDIIGLQTYVSGLWVSAIDGGGGAIDAHGVRLDTWESFRIALSDGTGEPQDPPDEPQDPPDEPDLVWRRANLTNFTSYPDPGSEECIEYNGCTWAGYFAGVDGQQSEQWVMSHNIAAVHSRDFGELELKTLRLRQGDRQIDVTVYDMCADSDCSGCCTENAEQNGLDFLIDIERYTMERFGSGDGIVEWACLDC